MKIPIQISRNKSEIDLSLWSEKYSCWLLVNRARIHGTRFPIQCLDPEHTLLMVEKAYEFKEERIAAAQAAEEKDLP